MCGCVCLCVRACVCEREREREKVCVYVCVRFPCVRMYCSHVQFLQWDIGSRLRHRNKGNKQSIMTTKKINQQCRVIAERFPVFCVRVCVLSPAAA